MQIFLISDTMRTLLYKTLAIILSMVVVSSCIKPYYCHPLETYEISAEGQEYVLDTKEDIRIVSFNFGDGGPEIFDTMEGVEHGQAWFVGSSLSFDGGWFNVEVKKEKEAARRFVVSFEPNRGPTSRTVEIYVDAMYHGHFTNSVYHIILSQAPFDGN